MNKSYKNNKMKLSHIISKYKEGKKEIQVIPILINQIEVDQVEYIKVKLL